MDRRSLHLALTVLSNIKKAPDTLNCFSARDEFFFFFFFFPIETSVTFIYKKINAKASLCGRVVNVPEQQTEFLIGSFCINSPGLLREIFSVL